ncbi:MAG: hypothetical protein ACREMQ_16245 [Longimicrobiales bacterium]
MAVTMQAQTGNVDARFARRWVRATFAGWALGFVLMLVMIGVSGVVGLGDRQFPIGLGMGAGVGFLQGRLIAQQVRGRRAWLIASSIGMAAPFLAFDLAGVVGIELVFSLPIAVMVGGLVVGILQWPILRKLSAASVSWIGASTVGWSLAGSMALLNDRFLPKIPGLVGALLYVAVVLVGGILLGAVGGLTLQRILPPATAAASGDVDSLRAR